MSYKILSIPPFDKQIKRLIKKYPSLKAEYYDLIEELEKNPQRGIPLGNHCYKIRMAIASKGRGKSGGARVITHFYIEDKTVFLLTVYDKSEQTDISSKELRELLMEIV
jgi:mRNA-degrading endonuclease RelE of RelBE toxin-antitoxin system